VTVGAGAGGGITLQPPLPAAWLAGLRLPPGVALVPGGCGQQPLPLRDPPRAALDSQHRADQLALLAYAGVGYAHPESPAAAVGLQSFEAGRALGRDGPHRAISFDWDHTVSNYTIFQGIPALLRARLRRSAPSAALAATPVVSIEMARPFMTEFVFGAVAGFALRQGLSRLTDWSRYRPQVHVATHTWPDRLGLIGKHFMPLLPLMEGLLPGSPQTYARLNGADVRSLIHLHHFMDHAIDILTRFDRGGLAALTVQERNTLQDYVADGSAHRCKPLGVWARRGCDTAGLLHVDDATCVVQRFMRGAAAGAHPEDPEAAAGVLQVRHPHSRVFRDIQEWHKVSLPGLWRRRQGAIVGAARRLACGEAAFPAVEPLLRRFAGDAAWLPRQLPAGTLIAVHEAPTTAGEFWRHYVEPVQRAQRLIGQLSMRHGGRRRLLQAWRVAPGLLAG